MKKQKRKAYIRVYLTNGERKEIDDYVKRLGYRTGSSLMRDGILRLARNPEFDCIYDRGQLFQEDIKRILLKKKFLSTVDKVLDVLDDNDLLDEDIGGGGNDD